MSCSSSLLSAFKCPFPGCSRAFAVRSNAKRHLKTHGAEAEAVLERERRPAYVVDFDEPFVSAGDSSRFNLAIVAPSELRWLPPSLAGRTNASRLSTAVLPEEQVDSGSEDDDNDDRSILLSIPLPGVIPTLTLREGDPGYEERNSYADAGRYPYHPAQVQRLFS